MSAGRFEQFVDQHLSLVQQAYAECRMSLETAAELLAQVLAAGNKIMLCGNGGSAADSQHMAAEIVGRFERERAGLPAIALSTDSSILTAVGNDYGFDAVFARQVTALARPGDLLWAYSTSGRSENVLAAMDAAAESGCTTLLLTGQGPNPASERATCALCVPSRSTARVQEVHALFGHILCAAIDQNFT